ncbi:MAG: divergent polysaccharide deacetylase family protein [Desulfatiglandales bacterium]
MAKKKKRGRKTQNSQRTLFSIVSACMFCAAISLGLLLYLTGSRATPSSPASEEVLSHGLELKREMGRIDRAVFEALYEGGIHPRDIIFLDVRPEHRGRYEWDFTELEVNLQGKQSGPRISQRIAEALSEFRPRVTFQEKRITEGEIHCLVFALGLNTHKIRIITDKREKFPQKTRRKIAIIVDDIGYDYAIARDFMAFPLPLSLSILPLAPQAEKIAKEANRRKCEIMLHLPMEPDCSTHLNPGPEALLLSMGDSEISEIVARHLEKIPGIKGVNNHMGSSFTRDRNKMGVVLGEVKKRGLFYIDSRTTTETVGLEVARKMGVSCAERSVFIDHELDEKAVQFQIERLLGIAGRTGSAVGICHPNKMVLDVLKAYVPRMKKEFQVVPASEIVR